MKKEEASGNDSSTIDMLRGYIKVFSIGELKARLSGVRNESRGLVVYEKGIVKGRLEE